MSCWDILEIEHTDDPVSIKRAYARKLKKTRPDEDPQGFSQLHTTYKQALQGANINRQTNPEPIRITELETTPSHPIATRSIHAQEPDDSTRQNDPTTTLEIPDPPTPRSPPVENIPGRELISGHLHEDLDLPLEDLNQAWDRLTEAADEVLSNSTRANEPGSWSFLNDCDALYHFDFKSSYSDFLFGRLVYYNESNNGHNILTKPPFDYLNSIFRWIDNRTILEDNYGHEVVESVLALVPAATEEQSMNWISPRQHTGPMIQGNYYSRVFSTALDLALVFFTFILISKYMANIEFLQGWLSMGKYFGWIPLYLAMVIVMTSTAFQATPGMLLFGLKVVSPRGKRLNILHSLLRTTLFLLSTAAFKITVWINLFLNDGRLLHDRLSRSMIIKR